MGSGEKETPTQELMVKVGHGQFPARWGWFLSQSMVNLIYNIFFYESQSFPTIVCLTITQISKHEILDNFWNP
jgi:hypothetical protein